MKHFILGVALGLALLVFSYVMWGVSRSINYTMSYKGMVQQTIREMVKQESLK